MSAMCTGLPRVTDQTLYQIIVSLLTHIDCYRPTPQFKVGVASIITVHAHHTTRKAMAELEGFLCPLCKADCRSVHELEKHYREEHEESSSGRTKLINNFKNFVDMAKTSLKIDTSPKSGARDAGRERTDTQSSASAECSLSLSTEGPVTNVSGISTELWEPQGIGEWSITSGGKKSEAKNIFSPKGYLESGLVL